MPASPEEREFWDQRYRRGRTPWDAGGIPPALERFLQRNPGRGAKVLIPGCGSGYEIEAFARAGYTVSAIDFSPAAVERARTIVGPVLGQCIAEGDFFAHPFAPGSFDLIYERTFLCALPPEAWPRIAVRSAELLGRAGRIVGIYYYGEQDGAGPPYALAPGQGDRIFAERFVTVHDAAIPPEESLPLFAGAERWQERQRVG